MTDKHTPGSWDVNPHDMRHDSWPVFSEDRYRVAEIPNVNRSPANAANARLIAAAPDLLDALRGMLNIGETKAEYDAAIQRAVDAIAKATGEGA